METVYNALVSILMASPTILVAFVGCLLAIFRWKRHPKVSLLALIAFLIYMGSSVFFPLIYAILPTFLRSSAWSTQSYSVLYRGMSLLHYLIEAVALALLLAAVLAGRSPQQPNPYSAANERKVA